MMIARLWWRPWSVWSYRGIIGVPDLAGRLFWRVIGRILRDLGLRVFVFFAARWGIGFAVQETLMMRLVRTLARPRF